MKGGGDAVSAARAVLQTGEFDLAWNLQVEDEVLKRLEAGGKGEVILLETGNLEHLQCNFTDPNTEVDGERSSLKTKHPILQEKAVRQALALLCDRKSVEDHIYGRTGSATSNVVNSPTRFRSKNTSYEFNIDKAIKVLDDAGWKPGADGIRQKDGKKMKFVYQTSINAPRQKNQQIIKQAAQRAGIDIELKSVTASVFFSSDVANPDTYTKFYCDLQMYTVTMPQPDPQVFMQQWVSWEKATKDNKWQGRNIIRWENADYDKAFREAEAELDPVKRGALLISMNDMVVNDFAVIPLLARRAVTGANKKLKTRLSGWDNTTAFLADWYMET
jgi:peptide/nickel transport system substrate-binding protein